MTLLSIEDRKKLEAFLRPVINAGAQLSTTAAIALILLDISTKLDLLIGAGGARSGPVPAAAANAVRDPEGGR